MPALVAAGDLLTHAVLFADCSFAVSLGFLLWNGYERRPLSPAAQSRSRGLIAVLAAAAYLFLTGEAFAAIVFGALAWGLTRTAAQFLPDWNSRGQAHFAAFLTTIALVMVAVVQAIARLGPNPWGLALSAGIFGFAVLMALMSVGFVYEALNVGCRTRRRQLCPPMTFHSGYAPKASIHVPAHSEPPDVVIATLESLTRLDYLQYKTILIDNNTTEDAL